MRRLYAILLSFSLACCLLADNFRPDDVQIVGDLDYGRTSEPVEYSGKPPYNAFVFNGNSGDSVDVTVKGGAQEAFVAIADGSLNQLARGASHLAFKLPNAGPDLQAYYVVFSSADKKPARLTVELKKTGDNDHRRSGE